MLPYRRKEMAGCPEGGHGLLLVAAAMLAAWQRSPRCALGSCALGVWAVLSGSPNGGDFTLSLQQMKVLKLHAKAKKGIQRYLREVQSSTAEPVPWATLGILLG